MRPAARAMFAWPSRWGWGVTGSWLPLADRGPAIGIAVGGLAGSGFCNRVRPADTVPQMGSQLLFRLRSPRLGLGQTGLEFGQRPRQRCCHRAARRIGCACRSISRCPGALGECPGIELGDLEGGAFIAAVVRGSGVQSPRPFVRRLRVRPSSVVQTPSKAVLAPDRSRSRLDHDRIRNGSEPAKFAERSDG